MEDVDAWVCGLSEKRVLCCSLRSRSQNLIQQQFDRLRNTAIFYFDRIEYITPVQIERLETVRNLVDQNAIGSKILLNMTEMNMKRSKIEIGDNPFSVESNFVSKKNFPTKSKTPKPRFFVTLRLKTIRNNHVKINERDGVVCKIQTA